MPPASMRTSTSRLPSGAAGTVSMRRSLGAYRTAARMGFLPGSFYLTRFPPASPSQGHSMSMFDLTGRIALVTGSSRGIGRAIAEGYVAAGARVIINGRDEAAVDAAVKALGGKASAAPFDVTDKAAIEAAVEKIEKHVGPLDILVNNAGMQKRAPIVDFPEAD